jgi:polysaccharide pyruvyl transferase WcaK-like protein
MIVCAVVKISHLTNLRSPNVGNAALTLGSERTLKEDLGGRITFERVAWDDYTFGKKSFESDFLPEIAGSNALLVAGAVTFNGRTDFDHSGMRFNLSLAQIDSIDIPIFFYGSSYRYWSSDPYPNKKMLKQALTTLCNDEKNKIAVRNDGTREWLKNVIDFQHESLRVIPDPGLFIRYNVKKVEYSGVPYICVSLNNEDANDRFHGNELQSKFISDFAEILNFVLENFPQDIYLVPHSFEDLSLIELVTRKISPRNLHQRVRVLGLPRFENAESIYEVYENASLVIASRVHSMSPALGMKIPVIVITTQDRLTHFMREMGLGMLVLDYSEKDLIHKLKHMTNQILSSDKTYVDEIADSVATARAEISRFNDLISRSLDLNQNENIMKTERTN